VIVMNRIAKGWRPNLKVVEEEDKQLAEMIEWCMQQKADDRPTFLKIVDMFENKLVDADLVSNFKGQSEASKKYSQASQGHLEDKPINQRKIFMSVHNKPVSGTKSRRHKEKTTTEQFDPKQHLPKTKKMEKAKDKTEDQTTTKIDPGKALFALVTGQESKKESEFQKAEKVDKVKKKQDENKQIGPGMALLATVTGARLMKEEEKQEAMQASKVQGTFSTEEEKKVTMEIRKCSEKIGIVNEQKREGIRKEHSKIAAIEPKEPKLEEIISLRKEITKQAQIIAQQAKKMAEREQYINEKEKSIALKEQYITELLHVLEEKKKSNEKKNI